MRLGGEGHSHRRGEGGAHRPHRAVQHSPQIPENILEVLENLLKKNQEKKSILKGKKIAYIRDI